MQLQKLPVGTQQIGRLIFSQDHKPHQTLENAYYKRYYMTELNLVVFGAFINSHEDSAYPLKPIGHHVGFYLNDPKYRQWNNWFNEGAHEHEKPLINDYLAFQLYVQSDESMHLQLVEHPNKPTRSLLYQGQLDRNAFWQGEWLLIDLEKCYTINLNQHPMKKNDGQDTEGIIHFTGCIKNFPMVHIIEGTLVSKDKKYDIELKTTKDRTMCYVVDENHTRMFMVYHTDQAAIAAEWHEAHFVPSLTHIPCEKFYRNIPLVLIPNIVEL